MAAPIALQLYTVRDALAQNFKSVVTRIAEIGYVGVETAGFPGISVDEASDLFADLGLDVCSVHTQLPLGKQKNQVIELAQELEATRVVSSTPRDAFTSADALKALCDQLEPSRRYRRRERVGTRPPQSLVGVPSSRRASGFCAPNRRARRIHLLSG